MPGSMDSTTSVMFFTSTDFSVLQESGKQAINRDVLHQPGQRCPDWISVNMQFPATQTLTLAMKEYFEEMLRINEKRLSRSEVKQIEYCLAKVEKQIVVGEFISTSRD